jgi:centromere protein I
VDGVCLTAYEDGLPNASLSRLVDLISLPSELDQASLASLVRNLYPASKVPDAIVARIVGSLGHGRTKCSYTVQAMLLRWLVMVYDILENSSVLSQLYGILFNLLDTVAIRCVLLETSQIFTDFVPRRPQLCHVLSLTTRRKHVRPFRIQMLMELTRQAGNDPPLIGLMRVYKDYYPDVIVGVVTSGRASVFTVSTCRYSEVDESLILLSIQILNGDRGSEKFRRRIFKRHKTVYHPRNEPLELLGKV